MDDKPVKPKLEKRMVFTVDETEKGVQTFEVEMTGLELIQTGTKIKDGKVVEFYKFKIVKK